MKVLTNHEVVTGRSPLDIHALITSEIAEATEEARKGNPDVYQWSEDGSQMIFFKQDDWRDDLKPEGEAIELADAIIRILDYAGSKNWDMQTIIEAKMKYNDTRSYRHGGKKF